jgi:hypothetical protein
MRLGPIAEQGPVRRMVAVVTMCSALACGARQTQREATAGEIAQPPAVAPRSVSDRAELPDTPPPPSGHPLLPGHGQVVSFEGTCDASGAIPLDDWRFAVADDEDNVLRIYDAERGGPPIESFDLSSALAIEAGGEADIEAATRLDGRAYFLTSHGRTRAGAIDPDRFLFFATEVPSAERPAAVVGTPFRALADGLIAAPSLAAYDLRGALARGELELEGLTATDDAGMWLGFRRPIPEGRALIVRLTNPAEVVMGAAPRIEAPQALDLGGLGVRGLSSWRGQYLIIAGPAGNGGPFALYQWPGHGDPTRLVDRSLDGFGPEGFFSPPGRDGVMILSDDGTRLVDGVPCKRLREAARKGFRGIWLQLASR